MSETTRTYSTSVILPPELNSALDDYARLFSLAQRTAYVWEERDIRNKADTTKAVRKAKVAERFGLTSRQSNAVLMEADAKRSAIQERYLVRLEDLTAKLRKKKTQHKRDETKLAKHRVRTELKLTKPELKKLKSTLFYCKTKITSLTLKIDQLNVLIKSGKTALTFGTKKLLRQRATVTRKELVKWRKTWDDARNNQFVVLGSKDETAGCQGCVAQREPDGSYTLRVRLPDSIGGQHVVLSGLRFAYGENRLRYALEQQLSRSASKKELLAKKLPDTKISQKDVEGGVAITWRFARQPGGEWRISFMTSVATPQLVSHRLLGRIGVDLNSGFISVAETDRFGNVLWTKDFQLPEVGQSTYQRAAARGEVVKQVIALCIKANKPLALEKLEFSKKKRDLEGRPKRANAKLSSLGYNALHYLFSARALDAGIEVISVNPAYTSTQGQLRYANRFGLSIHQAAACVIARRSQGFFEVAPTSGTQVVLVAGVAVEWDIPVEISRSNVSRRWSMLHKEFRRTITTCYRNRHKLSRSPNARLRRLCGPVVSGEIPGSKLTVGVPAFA